MRTRFSSFKFVVKSREAGTRHNNIVCEIDKIIKMMLKLGYYKRGDRRRRKTRYKVEKEDKEGKREKNRQSVVLNVGSRVESSWAYQDKGTKGENENLLENVSTETCTIPKTCPLLESRKT